jgi:hypothetical protein
MRIVPYPLWFSILFLGGHLEIFERLHFLTHSAFLVWTTGLTVIRFAIPRSTFRLFNPLSATLALRELALVASRVGPVPCGDPPLLRDVEVLKLHLLLAFRTIE